MTDEDKARSEAARKWVRKNKSSVLSSLADIGTLPKAKNPVAIFMAGSPGAGKTELSKRYVKAFVDAGEPIVRIDADEVRAMVPGYDGRNSEIFQSAASLGVEILLDRVMSEGCHFVLDGTLKNFDKACSNIERVLKVGRQVQVFYVYQEPLIAWEFVKKREATEGRRIPKAVFIDELFDAYETVDRLKVHFGPRVAAYLFEKNFRDASLDRTEEDVESIASHLKIAYTKEELMKLCKD